MAYILKILGELDHQSTYFKTKIAQLELGQRPLSSAASASANDDRFINKIKATNLRIQFKPPALPFV